LRDEARFPLREKHLEDPIEKLRGRGSLGELIDALREAVVCVFEVLMGHDRNPILFGLSDNLTTVYQKGAPDGNPGPKSGCGVDPLTR